jgi:hypothetical protein
MSHCSTRQETYAFCWFVVVLYDSANPLEFWAHVVAYPNKLHGFAELHWAIGVHAAFLDQSSALVRTVFSKLKELVVFLWM